MARRILAPALAIFLSGWALHAAERATFILTDGDVLDLRSRVVGAYLDGRALDLTDKQKRLYEKYRHRPTPAATKTGGGQ